MKKVQKIQKNNNVLGCYSSIEKTKKIDSRIKTYRDFDSAEEVEEYYMKDENGDLFETFGDDEKCVLFERNCMDWTCDHCFFFQIKEYHQMKAKYMSEVGK